MHKIIVIVVSLTSQCLQPRMIQYHHCVSTQESQGVTCTLPRKIIGTDLVYSETEISNKSGLPDSCFTVGQENVSGKAQMTFMTLKEYNDNASGVVNLDGTDINLLPLELTVEPVESGTFEDREY